MADDRSGARGGYASNSPYGEEDRDRHSGRTERGFFGRTGNELRSWFGFGDDDPEGSYGRGTQSWGQANEGGNWGSGGGNFGPHDQHYLSWRDRQIAELDRDYEEYCREHDQDFHSSFENWRRNRRSGSKNSGEQSSGAPASAGSSGERSGSKS